MSVRTALYEALTADATLMGLVTGVHHQVAPQDAAYPVVVFHRQDGRPRWTFTAHVQWDLWTVKAIDVGGSAATAEQAADRIIETLDDAALNVAPATLLYVRRESDVDYVEVDGDRIFHHAGSTFRIVTQPA